MENIRALKYVEKKNNKSLSLLLAVGGLLIVAVAFYLILKPIGALQNGLSSANVYKDKDFELTAPAGWTALSSEELSKESEYFSYAIRHDSPGALITVKAEQREQGNVGLSELSKAIDKRLSAQFDGLEMLDRRIIQIGQGEAIKYDYVITGGNEGKIRQQLYVYLSDTKAYYVTAQASSSDFAAVQGEVDEIIKGFSTK